MTEASQGRRQPSAEDEAISTAVWALLHARNETVTDLAYWTRLAPATIYRKLAGQASWKAADVGAVAKHFGVSPGDLFAGYVLPQQRDRRHTPATANGGPNGVERRRGLVSV